MQKHDEHKDYEAGEIKRLIGLLNSEEELPDEVRDEIDRLMLDERYEDQVIEALEVVWEESKKFVFTPEQAKIEKQITLRGIAKKCPNFPVKPATEVQPGKTTKSSIQRRPLSRRLAFRVAAVVLPLLMVAGAVTLLLEPDHADTNGFFARLTGNQTPAAPSEPLVFEASGDTTTLTLPDGSAVRLDAGARLEYLPDFLENRAVTLTGSAFFTVAKMEGKPFEVSHQEKTIRVLGTEFYVKEKETATEVTLCTGSVEIAHAGRTTRLEPNQRYVTELHGSEFSVVELTETQIARIRHGRLHLRGEALTDALRQAGEFFETELEIVSLGDSEPVWLEFGIENELEEILFVLQTLSENAFSYEINEGKVVIRR